MFHHPPTYGKVQTGLLKRQHYKEREMSSNLIKAAKSHYKVMGFVIYALDGSAEALLLILGSLMLRLARILSSSLSDSNLSGSEY